MKTKSVKPSVADRIPLISLSMITEARFNKLFCPLKNPYLLEGDNEYALHAAVFDPDGKQLQHVKDVCKTDPRRVWTLMDIQDEDVIVSGYQYAKRHGYCSLGYLITETAINDGLELYVPVDRKLI